MCGVSGLSSIQKQQRKKKNFLALLQRGHVLSLSKVEHQAGSLWKARENIRRECQWLSEHISRLAQYSVPLLTEALYQSSMSHSVAWRKLVQFILLVTHIVAGAFGQEVPPTQSRPFDALYRKAWNPDKIHRGRDGSIGLTLDQQDGSGYASRNLYMFGYISTAIKLVAGDSSGVVTAYYLSSNMSKSDHDELDFEFLGNKSGEPYILQTNVFANGVGRREQRIYLWFDPTTGYHNYSVLWNRELIIFSVDQVPIRVFKNNENIGVGYPQSRPMGIYSTIWDGQTWATRGGSDKTDWTVAPFVASFENFIIDACWSPPSLENSTTAGVNSTCEIASKWWAQPQFQSIDGNLQTQLKFVKEYYMVYNYCTDYQRYRVAPPECTTN